MPVQGVYAPSEIDNGYVVEYENRVSNVTNGIYRDMNSTLYSYRAAAYDGALPRLSSADWSSLNS